MITTIFTDGIKTRPLLLEAYSFQGEIRGNGLFEIRKTFFGIRFNL
jgi:hypothetical protein